MERTSCWIFLSHASADIEKIRMIRNEFEACGHNPLAFHLKCLNDDTPQGKEELWNLIYREIEVRDWFVFCDSEASRRSKNVSRERAHIIDIGKKFVWTLDLSQPDDVIRDRIHMICSQLRVFVSVQHSDFRRFGEGIIKALQRANYDVWNDELSLAISAQSISEQIETAISVYGKTGICLLMITPRYLQSSYCMMELDSILDSGANCIAFLFEGVEAPERIRHLSQYRIPHAPHERDVFLIKELLDAILSIEIKGPIQFDAHVYDKLSEISEKLNYTHRCHRADAVLVKTLGPMEDYGEIWRFPCCGTTVRVGERKPSRFRSDGCCEEAR